MQESYKTPTVAQENHLRDCVAEDLKPRTERTLKAVMAINERLLKAGIKFKHIDPTVKQSAYQYKSY